MGPDHGSVWDVCFIEDTLIFCYKAKLLIKSLTLNLGMDIDRLMRNAQGTTYQEFSIMQPTVGGEHCNAFQFGSFFRHPDTYSPYCFITDEQQEMTAVRVFSIEIDGLAYALSFDENLTSYVLAHCKIALIGS